MELNLKADILVEVATFLARCWSSKSNVIVEFSNKNKTITSINENKIILLPTEGYIGDDFQKYRQFRTRLWYESMRIRFCKKILSNDHAFGYILNTLEMWRIEILSRRIWRGVGDELIFNY